MRKLIVSEFMTLDGVMQAPGAEDEDREGGFKYGGWTLPYWHDDIGASFLSVMEEVDTILLGRKTYVMHAEAFEPMEPGNPFGDALNPRAKYVVSQTLEQPLWRNTTIIRDKVVETITDLKARDGKGIITDGSHVLVHTLLTHGLVDELYLLVYPVTVGSGKRVLPPDLHATFTLKSATPFPTGVLRLHYLAR